MTSEYLAPMTRDEAQQRHAQLAEELRQHDHAYYVLAKPTISDREYDLRYRELLDLEKAYPELVTASSPSQRVGGAPSEGFERVQHIQPMLSLEKVEASDHPTKEEEPTREKRNRLQDENTLQSIIAFDATIRKQLQHDHVDYVMEPKVDGVSIAVHYRHGKMVLGVTRGDGQVGDDITANLRTVRAIPLELKMKNPPALLEVRGEAYISTKDFDALNAKSAALGEKSFPNARNATAGTLKQLDPRLVAQRPISAVFYAIGACEGIEFQTHAELLKALSEIGLPTQNRWWLCENIEQVIQRYREEVVCNYDEDHDLRQQLPYEIDGIVIKVNKIEDANRIPSKSRAPGYAIVHKPVPWITPAETILKAITVQVGRTGVLTPVAELEPVFVQGSTIARATLHNEDEIRRKDIRIGDTVVVRKAGMVIPEVLESVKSKRPSDATEFDFYAYVEGKCPACGGPIIKEKSSTGRTVEVAWRCQNIAGCPAQITQRIEHFASRKALDIESLGGVVAEKLVERELVKEPLDLYELTLEHLATLNIGTDEEPRIFGEKHAAKVIDALELSKTKPLARWVIALGVPSVGETTANQVAKLHDNLRQVSSSEILKQCLQLYEKVEEAKKLSPDSRNHMGPVKKQLREKEVAAKTESDAEKKIKILSEVETLKVAEIDEWNSRVHDQSKVNEAIESLVTHLKSSGVELKIEKKPKQKKKDRDQAPPIYEVTANIEIDGIRNLLKYFQTETGRKTLSRIEELGISPTQTAAHSAVASSSSVFLGKTFVLTGTLPTLSRQDASELIRSAGGNVTSSVSKNTDYLLAGENAGTKLEKALELGVKTLSEADLLSMLGASKDSKTESQGDLF